MTATDPRLPYADLLAASAVRRRGAGSAAMSRLTVLAESVPLAAVTATVVLVGGLRLLRVLPAVGPAVLVAGLLIGLPHGAVDVQRGGRRLGRRGRALLGLAYVAAAGATFGLWWRWPTAAILALLLLAAAHFGDGDVAVADWSRPERSRRTGTAWRVATRVAFGGIAVATPFAVWPARTAPLLDALVADRAPVVIAVARAALPVVLAAAAAVALGALRAGDRWTAGALVALTALFFTVPPLIAFGVYFATWHAARQTCQQLAAGYPERTPLPDRLRAWAVGAAAPTAVTLLVLGLVTWRTGLHLPVSYLALLLSITVPHSLVDAWQARARA